MPSGFSKFLDYWITDRTNAGLLANSICLISKGLGAIVGTILYLYIFHFRKNRRRLILPQYKPIALFAVIFMYIHCILWYMAKLYEQTANFFLIDFAQSALDEIAYDGITLLLLKGHLGRTTILRTAIECVILGAFGGSFNFLYDYNVFGIKLGYYNMIYHGVFVLIYIFILVPLPLSIAAPRRNTVRAYAIWMLIFRLSWFNLSSVFNFAYSGPAATMTNHNLMPYTIFSLFMVMVSELPFALCIFAIARADTVYWVLGGRILVKQQQSIHGVRYQKQLEEFAQGHQKLLNHADSHDSLPISTRQNRNNDNYLSESQDSSNHTHIQRTNSVYLQNRINFDENNLNEVESSLQSTSDNNSAPNSMDFLFDNSMKQTIEPKKKQKKHDGELYQSLIEETENNNVDSYHVSGDVSNTPALDLKKLLNLSPTDPRSLFQESMGRNMLFQDPATDIDISLMASVVQNNKNLLHGGKNNLSTPYHQPSDPLNSYSDISSGMGSINDSLFDSSSIHSSNSSSNSLYSSNSDLSGTESYDHNITEFYDYTSDLPRSLSSSQIQQTNIYGDAVTTHIRPFHRFCHSIRAVTIDIIDMIFLNEEDGDDVYDQDDEVQNSVLNRIELRILNDANDHIVGCALQSLLETNVKNLIYYQQLVSLDHHDILGSGAFSKVYSGLLALTSQQSAKRKQMYGKILQTHVQHVPYTLSLFFRLHFESTIAYQYKLIATKYQHVLDQQSSSDFDSSAISSHESSANLDSIQAQLRELYSLAQTQWNKSTTNTTLSAVISQYIDNREYDSLCINDTLGLWNREFCMANSLLANGLLLDLDSPNYLFYLYRYLSPEACSQLVHDSQVESLQLAKTLQSFKSSTSHGSLNFTPSDLTDIDISNQYEPSHSGTPHGFHNIQQLDEYASKLKLEKNHHVLKHLNETSINSDSNLLGYNDDSEIVSNSSTQLLNKLLRLEASHREYLAERARETSTACSSTFLESPHVEFIPIQNSFDEQFFITEAQNLLKKFLIHISAEYTLSSLGYIHYTMNNKVLPSLEQVAQNSFYVNPSPTVTPCPTNLSLLNPINSDTQILSITPSKGSKNSLNNSTASNNESFLFNNKISGSRFPISESLSHSLSNMTSSHSELRSTVLSNTNWITQQHNPLLDIPFNHFNLFSSYLQSAHQLHSAFSKEHISPIVSSAQLQYATSKPSPLKTPVGKSAFCQHSAVRHFDSFYQTHLSSCSFPIQPTDRETFKLLWKLTEPANENQSKKKITKKNASWKQQSTELILLKPLNKLDGKNSTSNLVTNSIYNLQSNSLKIAAKFFLRSLALEPATIDQFSHETRLHCSLQHPNVVWLLGLCVLPPALAILSEICTEGSLMDIIQKQLTRKHELSTTVLLLHKIKTQLESTINTTRYALLHKTTESLTGGKLMICPKTAAAAIQIESIPPTPSSQNSPSRHATSSAIPQQHNIPFSSYLLKIQDLYNQLYKAQANMVNLISKVHTIRDRLCLARDCASSIAYLHSRKILHRDIKTPNFLVDSKLRVKLTDFGLSCELPQSPDDYYQSIVKVTPFNPYTAAPRPRASLEEIEIGSSHSNYSSDLIRYTDSLPQDDNGMLYITTKTQINTLLSLLFPSIPVANDDGMSILSTIYDYSSLLETLGCSLDQTSRIEDELQKPTTGVNIFNEKYIPYYQYSTVSNNVLNTKPTSNQIFHAILQQQDYFSRLRGASSSSPSSLNVPPAIDSTSESSHGSTLLSQANKSSQQILSDATLMKNDKSTNNICHLGVSNGAILDSNLPTPYGAGIVQFDYQLLPFVLHSIRVHQGFSTSPAYPNGFSFPFQETAKKDKKSDLMRSQTKAGNNTGNNSSTLFTPPSSYDSNSFFPSSPGGSSSSDEAATQRSQIHHRQLTTQKMGTTLTNLLENSVQTLDTTNSFETNSSRFNTLTSSPRSRTSSRMTPRPSGSSSRQSANLLEFDLGEQSTQGEVSSSFVSNNDVSTGLTSNSSVGSDIFPPTTLDSSPSSSLESNCAPCDSSVTNFTTTTKPTTQQSNLHILPRSTHRYSGHQHISSLQNMLYDSLATAANQFNDSLHLQTPSQTYSVNSFSIKSSIRSSREIANTQIANGSIIGTTTGVSTAFPSALCYGPNHIFTRPVSKDALLWTRTEDFDIFSPQYHPPVDFTVLFDDDMLLFPLKLNHSALELFQRMAKRVDNGSKLNNTLTGQPDIVEKKINPRLKYKGPPKPKQPVTANQQPPAPVNPFKFEIDNQLMNKYITLKMTHHNQTITQSLRKYSVYSTLSRRVVNKYHTNLKNSLTYQPNNNLNVSASLGGVKKPSNSEKMSVSDYKSAVANSGGSPGDIIIEVDTISQSSNSAFDETTPTADAKSTPQPQPKTAEEKMAEKVKAFEEHLERKSQPKPLYNEDDFMTVGVGSKLWMAPEVSHIAETAPNSAPFDSSSYRATYSYPSDIYSLGIVLYEIITQNPPPENKNDLKWSPFNPTTLNNSNTCNEIPLHIKLLITACLSPRPEDRPSAHAIVNVVTLCIELLDNFYIQGNY